MPYYLNAQQPLWLLLAALLPVLWLVSRRSLPGLGVWRARVVFALRSLVLLAIVLALAETQWNRRSDEVTVAYLLDQSDSIPAEARRQMLEFVEENVARHRRDATGDRAAVIVFGREPAVEYPPVDFTPSGRALETIVDQTATNLEDALTKAAAVMSTDSARRIVIVSDGNENIGAAAQVAQRLMQSGIGVDVVPAPLGGGRDVLVERVATPSFAQKDRPLEVRVVLSNRGADARNAAGTLRIVRKSGGNEATIVEQHVELPPGKSAFSFRQQPDESDFYVYEARFVPDDPASDRFVANNLATGFTDVRGKGRVLLIEDHQYPGEFHALVESLRQSGLEVDVRPSDRAFSSLAELQRYDSVLLANVPRTTDLAADSFVSLSDDQIEMLVRNTKELGCGLVMLGGSRSFGAGGWAGTPLEAAMPVDFRIKNAKVVPVGALALVIDKSGSMSGEKMHLSLAAARAAIKMLGPRDFITVSAFDGQAYPVLPLERVGDGRYALGRVSQLGAGGGTNLYPGMQMASDALRTAQASVKHMIVLTDGQTPPADFVKLCLEMRKQGITVSAVAIGPDADRALLAQIAAAGGGKFYNAINPNNVPRIFMHEARRVATPVVRLLAPPRSPLVETDHEILNGIPDVPPPIAGFVQTTLKQSPLVQVLWRSPVPESGQNATVLAVWNYGVGKAVALTTDAGRQWANSWTAWPEYQKFFSQLVRWSMRPVAGSTNYLLATQSRGDKTQVIVDAISDQQRFVNELGLTGTVVGPNFESIPLTLEQTAPGRYVGEFDSTASGSYFISVATGQGPPLRAGVNVSYSREYDALSMNLPLLERLAEGVPRGGESGRLVTVVGGSPLATEAGRQLALELDPYRRDLAPAVARRDVWPLMVVLASVLFFGDVFVRRVQWDFGAIRNWAKRLVGQREALKAPPTLARLTAKKAEVRARYQPQSPVEVQQIASETKRVAPVTPAEETSGEDSPAEESFTSRLLAAKRAAAAEHQRRGRRQ
jgi:Mg-chelatase subunit ChlD